MDGMKNRRGREVFFWAVVGVGILILIALSGCALNNPICVWNCGDRITSGNRVGQ